MRLAVLSDIHANIYAFEAVVKDLRREKPDQVIFLGDLIINGLYPRECWDLLSDLEPDICIKGNTDGFHEYFLMNPEPTAPNEQYAQLLDAYAAAQVPGSALDEISSWEIFEQRLMEEEPIGFCHGTPMDFEEKMTGDDLSGASKRQILDLELQTLFCGHTHLPGQFMLGDMQVINFGAIGYSFDSDRRAGYGIVDITGDGVFPIQKRVTYDTAAYLQDIRRENPPFAENLSYIIEHAAPPKK